MIVKTLCVILYGCKWSSHTLKENINFWKIFVGKEKKSVSLSHEKGKSPSKIWIMI
jgi:hypothetical protein